MIVTDAGAGGKSIVADGAKAPAATNTIGHGIPARDARLPWLRRYPDRVGMQGLVRDERAGAGRTLKIGPEPACSRKAWHRRPLVATQ